MHTYTIYTHVTQSTPNAHILCYNSLRIITLSLCLSFFLSFFSLSPPPLPFPQTAHTHVLAHTDRTFSLLHGRHLLLEHVAHPAVQLHCHVLGFHPHLGVLVLVQGSYKGLGLRHSHCSGCGGVSGVVGCSGVKWCSKVCVGWGIVGGGGGR